METGISTEVLLSDYNYYRFHTANIHRMRTGGRSPQGLRPNANRLDALARMRDWCLGQGADPRLWLYFLFRRRKWLFAPPMTQLVPAKRRQKEALAQYHKLTAVELYAKRVGHEVAVIKREQGREYDPNRDLAHATEVTKRNYLENGIPERCMRAVHRTLGYHPKSDVCGRCPIAGRCQGYLHGLVRFDITSLRLGYITQAQAQAQVWG